MRKWLATWFWMVLLTMGGCSGNGSGSAPAVSVVVAPATSSVEVTASQQFTATVRNASNTAVTWQVNGVEGGSALTGTISASGLYTPPPCFPPSGVTITAVSQSDTSKSASASVTVTAAGNAKLNGRYASLAPGFSPVGATDARLMRLVANGSGGLTATGLNHHVSGTSALTPASSAYTVKPDDRGCVNLGSFSAGDPLEISGRLAAGVFDAGVATQVAFIDGDTVGTSTAGVWLRQDTTAFATDKITGDFAFGWSGGTGLSRYAIVGVFTADGVGGITAGTADINAGGTVSSAVGFSGTYSVGSDGHGTMTLNFATVPASTIEIDFDVVSASRLLVLARSGSDASFFALGEALKQSGAPFSNNALNGASVLHQTGRTPAGNTLVSVGLMSAGGTGSFTLSADENAGGTLSAKSINGTYSVAANGRTTTTETDGGMAVANPPVMYLVGANRAFVMATDSSASLGSIEPQTGGPFDSGSLSGTFLASTAAPANDGVTLTAGAVAFAAGTVSGTEDMFVSSGGGRSLLLDQSVSDDYTVSANGRVTFAKGAVMYVVSPSKALAVDAAGSSNPGVTVYEK